MALSSLEERRKVVNEVLGMMALRMAQSYRVGSVGARIISGGQRKRVNIGVELVSRPPLLFLDEPTSGLDASCSNVVLRSLLDLAVNGGVNVVAVIHQPRHSVFHMFHEIHLLGESGSTVYHGPPGKVREYFESLMYSFPPFENVADTLLDIVTGR
ncbi:hypothetical protein VOLCADRAFT_63329 [Volvox carteri f. nagariensis]|uniref:ABC transporter domain-containing protein n=1 Tax=Volvox carteri f. nagariensis TaxID=3068 RepID=D8U3C3_VOLCA|nr:uncharacterized protein VOLCADRAFT_63329 [Volvox carteri f. nagariensis]EFJ45801.1 hypothetical protein VOLCADRAFT_63329 [Volvox carteri f. nagariensis]|eukprot:XP_002953202.1 hypothetical protein VOLCADRAFT_63329 [Volvox carteri f. nagariensis]